MVGGWGGGGKTKFEKKNHKIITNKIQVTPDGAK